MTGTDAGGSNSPPEARRGRVNFVGTPRIGFYTWDYGPRPSNRLWPQRAQPRETEENQVPGRRHDETATAN